VIAKLGVLFPNLPDSIVERQALSPLDVERLFGMTGGHANHGDMALDQLFTMRPVRGCADYRTPIGACTFAGQAPTPAVG